MLISWNGNLASLKGLFVSHLPWNTTALPVSACVYWEMNSGCPFPSWFSFCFLILQVITLEGWVEIMYYVMDAHSFYNFIYFILLIIVSIILAVSQHCKLRAYKSQILGQHRNWLSGFLLGTSGIQLEVSNQDYMAESCTCDPGSSYSLKEICSGLKINTSVG